MSSVHRLILCGAELNNLFAFLIFTPLLTLPRVQFSLYATRVCLRVPSNKTLLVKPLPRRPSVTYYKTFKPDSRYFEGIMLINFLRRDRIQKLSYIFYINIHGTQPLKTKQTLQMLLILTYTYTRMSKQKSLKVKSYYEGEYL